MKKIWARIGMEIRCTDEEYEKLKELIADETNESDSAASDLLWELYYKHHELSGESYVPLDVDEELNPNRDFEF